MSARRPSTDDAASTPVGPANGGPEADRFGQQVHDALVHVDDPTYLQTHPLARLAVSDARRPESAGRALRQRLLDAVESLRPPRDTPPASEAWRRYEVLRLRYVEGLEIADVRERLGIGRSEYFREHRRALDAVTSLLADSLGTARREVLGGRVEPSSQPSRTELSRRTPHNLPLALTSFVGREREMSEVKRLLETTRLLTLTGAGGSGKTRLAIECARALSTERPGAYPDGVWLATLASLADPLLVPRAVASTLDVQEVPGVPLLDTLARQIGSKRYLVILDNCEHLLDACARLAERLLDTCPSVSLLATSRQPLGIPGETVWHVPSLPVPSADSHRSLEALAACDSVRLFVDRARSASPPFCLSEHHASAVAEICRRLDGIPLALELAATRVRALTPEQIATRLDRDLRLLAGGSRTALPRQQTLRATLDWSYDLLDEREAKLLRRLAVFAGGFALEAAEAVCSGDGIDQFEVVDLLTELIDKSLVEAHTADGDGRYRLLEPIRQYAWQRLEESGEMEPVRDRHKDWCLDLARQAEYRVIAPAPLPWLDRLETEHDNLRAALAWCSERDGEVGLEIVGCLAWFWDSHCHFQEGGRWATELLSKSSEETLTRAKALRTAGQMAAGEGASARAVELQEESVRLCRKLDDKRELAISLFALAAAMGGIFRNAGDQDKDRKEQLLVELLRLAREAGPAWAVSDALLGLSGIAYARGDGDRGRQLLLESLSVAREVGWVHQVAWALDVLGEMELLSGEPTLARTHLEEALALFRSERHGYGIATAAWHLASIALSEGRAEQGKALLAENLPWAQRLRWDVRGSLELAAELDSRSGDHQRAARLLGAIDSESRRKSDAYQPGHPDSYEAAVADAREALGDEAFARAWAEGEAMTLDQAVEYALQGGER